MSQLLLINSVLISLIALILIPNTQSLECYECKNYRDTCKNPEYWTPIECKPEFRWCLKHEYVFDGAYVLIKHSYNSSVNLHTITELKTFLVL